MEGPQGTGIHPKDTGVFEAGLMRSRHFDRLEEIVYTRIRKSVQYQLSQRGEAKINPDHFGILPKDYSHVEGMIRCIIPDGFSIKEEENWWTICL